MDKPSYKNGYWIWNDLQNGLVFISRDKDLKDRQSAGSASSKSTATSMTDTARDMAFNIDVLYRRYYQRKAKPNQANFVLLQDVKDVALFTSSLSFLTLELINYFHTKAMDTFLRSAIIYFQYYIQVWLDLQDLRKEKERTLRHPDLVLSENIIRDDLADLRSMLSRDYAVLLTGLGDAKEFHHMNNENNVSLSDKDRRLFEAFVILTVKIIWIALKRKYMTLIEKELNRLLRTDTFYTQKNPSAVFVLRPDETRILQGKNCRVEQKLLQRSPLTQEIILDDHDYRMLSIGISDVGCSNPRQEYLEAAYSAPEELLLNLGIAVGILGVPKRYFTDMLKPKEISTTKKRESIMGPLPLFVIPPKSSVDMTFSKFTDHTGIYTETADTTENRKTQHKLWKEHVLTNGQLRIIAKTANAYQSISQPVMTLITGNASKKTIGE